MKTGTSWIHDFLSWHDQVSVPSTVKETYFFSRNFHKGRDWFDSQFGRSDLTLAKGEVGPTYFPDVAAARLVKKHSPNAQVIVTLREPNERFLSHYHHNVRAGYINEGTPLDKVYSDMTLMRGHSNYYENIVRWQEIFGNDQVTVIFYEDLKLRPNYFVKLLCLTIGVEDRPMPEKLNKKVGERRVPYNASVTRIAARVVKKLRQQDMHRVVNTAKKLGGSKILYSKREPKVEHIEGAENIFAIFFDESMRLESDLGIDLSQWRAIWESKKFT